MVDLLRGSLLLSNLSTFCRPNLTYFSKGGRGSRLPPRKRRFYFVALPFICVGLKLDDAFGSMNGGELAGPPLGVEGHPLRWGGRLAISASLIVNAIAGGAIVAVLFIGRPATFAESSHGIFIKSCDTWRNITKVCARLLTFVRECERSGYAQSAGRLPVAVSDRFRRYRPVDSPTACAALRCRLRQVARHPLYAAQRQAAHRRANGAPARRLQHALFDSLLGRGRFRRDRLQYSLPEQRRDDAPRKSAARSRGGNSFPARRGRLREDRDARKFRRRLAVRVLRLASAHARGQSRDSAARRRPARSEQVRLAHRRRIHRTRRTS